MKYIGTELDLFAHATNWKRYFSAHLAPFVTGNVLEVGSGLGVNAPYLVNPKVRHYTFLEPDKDLLDKAPRTLACPCTHLAGTTADLVGKKFDTVLYLDVIEHIEHSAAELDRAAALLVPGGHLIILVPAFNFLYSPYDAAIGHFRRYTKKLLRSELPAEVEIKKLAYLDSTGLVLSLANRMLLRQRDPKIGQVRFWDSVMVPISRITDPLTLHAFGRSLIAVARKKS